MPPRKSAAWDTLLHLILWWPCLRVKKVSIVLASLILVASVLCEENPKAFFLYLAMDRLENSSLVGL